MPLWIHAPFEVVRGFVKWLSVTLVKDNPHRDPLKNATFTKGAKLPHRNAFWTGKPVVKGPKWRTMAWRWGLVFTVLAMVKYLPGAAWLAIGRALGDVLKWVGLDVIPWCWAHWAWLPVIVVGAIVGGYGAGRGFKRLVVWVRFKGGVDDGTPWYEYVLSVEGFVRTIAGRVRDRWSSLR